MGVSDAQFRLGVASAGVVLVAILTNMRFCGSVELPPKPAAAGPKGPARSLIARGAASPAVYLDFLEKDAAAAGTRVPSIEDMGRKLPYRVHEARQVLEVGQPAVELAALKLSVELENDAIVLTIQNTLDVALAYQVVTQPTPNISGCTGGTSALPHNAMVIARGATERRVECSYREGMALAIQRVETVEVPPLSAWYLSVVPPALVGIEERVARGHQGASASEKCSTVVSQVVRNGLQTEQIGWRDLVDFYARHRCATYRFPPSYRAFKRDGELALPAVAEGL